MTCGQDGQPVQAVGEIHRVGRADEHYHGECQIKPAQVGQKFLEERHGQTAGIGRFVQQNGQSQSGHQNLPQKLGPGTQALVLMVMNFKPVVEKAHQTESQIYEQGQPYINIGQVGPQQRAHPGSEGDEQAAHGGRAALAL